MITFTKHALNKFEILNRHNCFITKDEVLNILTTPNKVDTSNAPLLMAEGASDDKTIRVVYKEGLGVQSVLTFYPICLQKE